MYQRKPMFLPTKARLRWYNLALAGAMVLAGALLAPMYLFGLPWSWNVAAADAVAGAAFMLVIVVAAFGLPSARNGPVILIPLFLVAGVIAGFVWRLVVHDKPTVATALGWGAAVGA